MGIDPSKVKELRERTGLPMMECKNALQEAGGDTDAAIDLLRKRGAKAQEKLAGRQATLGRVASSISDDGRVGVLVTLCCETEPVSNNDNFVQFVESLPAVVAKERPADREAFLQSPLPAGGPGAGNTVAGGITELVNQLRENISLGEFALFEADAIGQYVHFDNKKAAMVALKGKTLSDDKVAEVGKDLCQHIVFHKPKALSKDDLDPGFLAKEREILLEAAQNDPKNAKKPPEILVKIIEGQMNKIAKEVCLLEQPFIKEEKSSVGNYLKSTGTGVSIEAFKYAATDI